MHQKIRLEYASINDGADVPKSTFNYSVFHTNPHLPKHIFKAFFVVLNLLSILAQNYGRHLLVILITHVTKFRIWRVEIFWHDNSMRESFVQIEDFY